MYPVHNGRVIVSARGLGKRFGPRWIFRDIDIDLSAGMCLLVTGNNGSGKSTLLRLLAGLENPTEGTITPTATNEKGERAYIALDQAVFPALTVREHLALTRELQELGSGDDAEIIDQCGLSAHADHQSQHLSSGLRSRLKIALAIQSNPKLLIWDEPSVALDEAGRKLVSDVVQAQLQRGALVLATNDSEERRFGTHALEL